LLEKEKDFDLLKKIQFFFVFFTVRFVLEARSEAGCLRSPFLLFLRSLFLYIHFFIFLNANF